MWNLWQSNLKLKFMKNQSFEVLCHKQIRNARRESKEKSAMKHSWWQSCQPFLEHFPKSIFFMLYIISNLRKSTIQCFKRCTIWSWNEGVTAIARRSLQAEGKFCKAAKSTLGCENVVILLRKFRSHFAQCCGISLEVSRYLRPTHWKPNTASWKPTSQRCEINLLLRSDFAALFVRLWNLVDLIFTCEMVLSASRYLRPTLWDIFLQIFVV